MPVVAAFVLAAVASGCGGTHASKADPTNHAVSGTSTPRPSPSAGSRPTPAPTVEAVTSTPVPEATPDGNPLVTVTVPSCCTVSLPSDWSLGVGPLGGYVAQGSDPALEADFTNLGTATCPSQPARGEGYTPYNQYTVTIAGQTVTAWVTAAADTNYQNIDADVVIDGSCIDVGGEERGVASTANREFLESIMESAAGTSAPSPTPSPTPVPTPTPTPTAVSTPTPTARS
jgi:hypothetical protein